MASCAAERAACCGDSGSVVIGGENAESAEPTLGTTLSMQKKQILVSESTEVVARLGQMTLSGEGSLIR
jgi:hypothetical protein